MAQEFIREREYLKAVSRPHILIWYGCSFKAFEGALDSKDAMQDCIGQEFLNSHLHLYPAIME
jgi:hypothetical protein